MMVSHWTFGWPYYRDPTTGMHRWHFFSFWGLFTPAAVCQWIPDAQQDSFQRSKPKWKEKKVGTREREKKNEIIIKHTGLFFLSCLSGYDLPPRNWKEVYCCSEDALCCVYVCITCGRNEEKRRQKKRAKLFSQGGGERRREVVLFSFFTWKIWMRR